MENLKHAFLSPSSALCLRMGTGSAAQSSASLAPSGGGGGVVALWSPERRGRLRASCKEEGQAVSGCSCRSGLPLSASWERLGSNRQPSAFQAVYSIPEL
uniref:Uncharacterized protein n=1 Tax=Salvator merianae TaxID=96440 RepID=A0A8D0E552_SALMN